MTSFVGVPTQPETFGLVTEKLHLRVHRPCGHAWMLGAIPNHDSTIGAHRRNDVRILRLIPGLVDLAFMVNLLNNIKLDLHLGLLGPATVASNLALVLVVILRVGRIWIGELDVGNLEVVLGITSGMGADEKAMSGVRLVRNSAK